MATLGCIAPGFVSALVPYSMLVLLGLGAICEASEDSCQALSAEYSTLFGANTTNVTTRWSSGYEVAFFIDEEQAACGQSWINIPGINLFNSGFRSFLYFIALCYCFLGIAIISDIFMAAVEQICAQEKTVTLKDGTTVTTKVWNATVANLTLMALGSSAPEILLSVIEGIMRLGGKPGELGPSTIAGSAAFNLLMITAVVIVAVPTGQVKSITDVKVFCVTTTWSILVYIWMYVVLDVWTPGVVSLLEAWITLLAMAVFVFHSYMQDRRWFMAPKEDLDGESGSLTRTTESEHLIGVRVTDKDGKTTYNDNKEEIKGMMKHLKQSGTAYKLKSVFSAVAAKIGGAKLRNARNDGFFWKVNLRHKLAGKKHVATKQEMDYARFNTITRERSGELGQDEHSMKSGDIQMMMMEGSGGRSSRKSSRRGEASTSTGQDILVSRVAFTTHDYRAIESQGILRVAVRRIGDEIALSVPSEVDYETHDGTAKAGENYEPKKGTLVFPAGEIIAYVEITIIDNYEPNHDTTFNITLSNHREHFDNLENPTPTLGTLGRVEFVLGAVSLSQVIIIDDDHPGMLSFQHLLVPVLETSGHVCVKVVRTGGAAGTVSVDYYTSDGSATAGKHYVSAKGTLVFGPKVTEQDIEVQIINNDEINPDTVFHVMLCNPTNLATIGRQSVAMVQIRDDDGLDEMATDLRNMLINYREAFHHATSSWNEQIMDALNPEGGVGQDGEELDLTFMDYFMHYLSIFWKLLFCIVPPTAYCGGWVTFFCSLVFIGALTTVVGEFASLFGCSIGLKDSITALSFVALGTSLPDTFASKIAAEEADDADAAIGNVTGSNTVNVLLGLGLPWVIGASYYALKPELTGGIYCVPSGTLAYSVMLFTVVALICIIFLFVRRRTIGGELGGSAFQKYASSIFLTVLWILYILLCALQAYGYITFGTHYILDDYGCRVGTAK